MAHLPNEILLKIFSNLSEVKHLTLVCKRWKELIENERIFNLLNYKERSAYDLWVIANSNRKYKSLKLEVDHRNLHHYIDVLRQSELIVEFVHIKIKQDVLRKVIKTMSRNSRVKLREMQEDLVKFKKLKTIDIECHDGSDIDYIYESCDLSSMKVLITNKFEGSEQIAENMRINVPDLKQFVIRRDVMPSVVTEMLRDLRAFFRRHADQIIVCGFVSLVISFIILVTILFNQMYAENKNLGN